MVGKSSCQKFSYPISAEGFVAARTALGISEGEFQPRDPAAKASVSELISIAQKIQTLICQVAASASEW